MPFVSSLARRCVNTRHCFIPLFLIVWSQHEPQAFSETPSIPSSQSPFPALTAPPQDSTCSNFCSTLRRPLHPERSLIHASRAVTTQKTTPLRDIFRFLKQRLTTALYRCLQPMQPRCPIFAFQEHLAQVLKLGGIGNLCQQRLTLSGYRLTKPVAHLPQ
jgi:hypothetical protein